MATLARMGREAGGRVTIVSSDKDLMQLIGDGVDMLDPIKNKRIDRDGVIEKFGVGPERVIDVQSLAGDSVDNVPGAPGIGLKTAAQLITEYGDLDTLLAQAEGIKQPKRREALTLFADQIRLSRQLVTLNDRTPLDFTLDDLEVRDPDPEVLLSFLARMEFRSVSKRIADKLGLASVAIPDENAGGAVPDLEEGPKAIPFDHDGYECIRTMEALKAWVAAIRDAGVVAVDTETTGLDEMRADLVGISLCVTAGKAAYIPVGHRAGSADLFGSNALAGGQLALADVLAALEPVLSDPAI